MAVSFLSEEKAATVYDEESVTVISPTEEEVSITESGSYYLSGDYTGGVTIAKKLTVHLYLDNANITSESGNALAVKTGGSVTITVVEGSVNTITSGGKNALNSNSPTLINGSGTLNIVSTAKNGE